MRVSAVVIAAAAAASSASVVHQLRDSTVPPLPGPDGDESIPDPNRTCTANGAKCSGADSFPRVEFKACCNSDDLVCGVPKEIPEGLWGFFCIKPEDAASELGDDSNSTPVPAAIDVSTGTAGSGTNTTAGDSPPTAGDGAGNSTAAAGDGAGNSTATAGDGAGNTTATAIGGAGASNVTAEDGVIADDDVEDVSSSPEDDISTSAAGVRTSASDEPEESDEEEDESVCFPADATVELEGGSIIRMDALSVGDVVKVGVNEYSPVFMFTHKLADADNAFVTITTAAGAKLSLTRGHYLYVNEVLSAAKTVVVGDELTLGDGGATIVTSVLVRESAGLYNPQTVKGDVVVNGILSSTYTTAVAPTLAHAVLSPFRLMQSFFTFCGLESGAGFLANVTPKGRNVL